MKPLVSVIMPALNEERAIEGTVATVLAQEGVELELLVIAGASVDRTDEILARLAEQDPRVRVVPNPRNVIPVALNLGLAAARGEFVARVDAHADIRPDHLRRGVDWLQGNPAMAAVGGLKRGVASTPVGRANALALSSRYGVGDSINHFATEPQLTDHASFAVVRTAAARQIGGWDETLLVNEDVDFDHRLLQAGWLIGFDPAMEFGWHVRETLPDLFRQYRRYGRGKGQMIRKNGRSAIRLRHLVPPAFVVGSAAVAVAGLARPALWGLLLPYAAVVGYASVEAWRGRDGQDVAGWALPGAFLCLHSGWGLGMLEAVVGNRQPYLGSGNSRVRASAA